MYVLQAIGIPNWGFRYALRSPRSGRRRVGKRESGDSRCLFYSGWILSLIALRKNTAVAVMMILVSLFFTAVAVLGIIMLKKVSEELNAGAKHWDGWVWAGVEHGSVHLVLEWGWGTGS